MSINQYAITIGSTGQANVPKGNFFFLIAASANVDIKFLADLGGGAGDDYSSVGVGLYLERKNPWSRALITGPSGTTLTYFVGNENISRDLTDYKLQIASITGVIGTVAGGSSNAPSDHADVSVTHGTTDTTIGVNAGRKSVTVGSLSTNTGANLRVRAHASGVGGVELQAGEYYNFGMTQALDVVNPDAAINQTYWWQEYS